MVLWRSGMAHQSEFAREFQFFNPWITPEPARHPWIEWMERLLLEEQLRNSIDAQAWLFNYFQQLVQQLQYQLHFTQEELLQRTNQFLHSQKQLRFQIQENIALRRRNQQLVTDLGTAREAKRTNRDLATRIIRKVTEVFNVTIPQLQ